MRLLGVVESLGVVALVASAAACGGSVRNHEGDGGGDPCVTRFGGACEPEPSPDPQPYPQPEPGWVDCELANEGDACSTVGETCSYGDECSFTTKSCGNDHVWHLGYEEDECCFDECCYGPGSYCPPDVPQVGDYCDWCYDGSACAYPIDIGCGVAAGVTLTCDPASYTWQVAPPACELPADACKLHASSDECQADAACRWLVPGCDAPALPAEGCFAATDCLACGGGEACTQVVVDPCPGADCGSCSAPAWVCQ